MADQSGEHVHDVSCSFGNPTCPAFGEAEPSRRRYAEVTDARWSVWFYLPGRWLGWPIYFGNAEGCTRTLVIGTRWTGCIVFGLWRMRHDPDCPECVERLNPPAQRPTTNPQQPELRERQEDA